MYYVENTFISSPALQPTAYFRYIDDIFLIWPHGIDTFETFLHDANRTQPNICFTHEYSNSAVSCLDVIINNNKGTISTSLHQKTQTIIDISYTQAVIQSTLNIPYFFHNFSDTIQNT